MKPITTIYAIAKTSDNFTYWLRETVSSVGTNYIWQLRLRDSTLYENKLCADNANLKVTDGKVVGFEIIEEPKVDVE